MGDVVTQQLNRACAELDIPVIETERLILRGWQADDAHGLADIHGDPEAMRYLGGKSDPSLSEAYRSIMTYMGHWALHGFGKWAVEERATGRLIGRTGYLGTPYEWPGLELGWTFNRAYWGKGYATESALPARDWAFTALGAERVISMINDENAASQAVARRIGERPWKPYPYRGQETTLWSIDLSEWGAPA